MNKIIKRFLSLIMVLGFVSSNILYSNFQTYAKDIDLFSLDFRAKVKNLVDAECECMAEATYQTTVANSNHSSRDNFSILHKVDHLPYNTIHILVQNHIRRNNPNLENNELYIQYTTNSN